MRKKVDSPSSSAIKNYITSKGFENIQKKLLNLIDLERPEIVKVVHWAASNGDRSENGDYIYGKKRLREIDNQIRFLTKRLDSASVIDPSIHYGNDQIFFGATVTFKIKKKQEEKTITIVGMDELDPLNGKISWKSPIANVLIKARKGDILNFVTPNGNEEIEVVNVVYPINKKNNFT
tara:strand:- start:249 stop:782 length:534 start_codon:yes stop_codon:yes gene_type:complete